MADEERTNPYFVGLPDNDAGDHCAFSLDLSAPRCDATAVWHIYGSSPWGDVALPSCDSHFFAAVAALREVYGSHPFGEGCLGEWHTWFNDHCEPGRANDD
jgi:hypothetical protein